MEDAVSASPAQLIARVCAASRDFSTLFAFRFIQRIGIGDEMPVAAAYISELSQERGSGSQLYRTRTLAVWTLWASAFFVANGLNIWLPTVYPCQSLRAMSHGWGCCWFAVSASIESGAGTGQ